MWYNFVRIHKDAARDTRMEAGVSNHVWDIEENRRTLGLGIPPKMLSLGG